LGKGFPEVTSVGVLASGRGSNCEALITAAQAGKLQAPVALVLSDREDAPVLATARRLGVEARYLDPGRPGARLTPDAERAYVDALRDAGVTWVALAGFMRIVGGVLLESFPDRIVNIHPSLLPAFPGLHAQKQALDYGVRIAGCTVHLVNAGIDTGPIVGQRSVPVEPGDTEETLSARILAEEHALYVESLNLLIAGRTRRDGRRVVLLEERDS
jgi:phosphoribosylglycinamide formyltransferase-1